MGLGKLANVEPKGDRGNGGGMGEGIDHGVFVTWFVDDIKGEPREGGQMSLLAGGPGVCAAKPSMDEKFVVYVEEALPDLDGYLEVMDSKASGQQRFVESAVAGLGGVEMFAEKGEGDPLTSVKLLQDGTSADITGIQRDVERGAKYVGQHC